MIHLEAILQMSENLKTIKDIPQKITSKDFPNDNDIRGEVL